MSRNGYTVLVEAPSYGDYTEQDRESPQRKKKSQKGPTEKSSLMAQVQNVKDKNVYVFSDGTVASNDDETIELNQMTQRGATAGHSRSYKSTTSSNQYEDIETKEIPLEKTDSLQSLSIKFRCSVSICFSSACLEGCKNDTSCVISYQKKKELSGEI